MKDTSERLVVVLTQVVHLLNKHQPDWAEVMKNLLNNYVNLTHSSTKKEAAELIMKSMLGGMGSLSDLVLHKEGKPLIEENEQLDTLLDELYDECKKVS